LTEQDRGDFATLMLGLGETYGEPVSDARMEIYFNALADMDLSDVRKAATAHVRMSKFFPRPAELRDVLDGSPEDRAELAWMTVPAIVRRFGYYREPHVEDWHDAATRRAALELYGGWRALCSSLPAEGPELLGYRKAFLAAYRAYDNRAPLDALPAHEGRELSRSEASAALASVMARLGK
jgi:hypothetical protein